ncbi:hypothetical protein H8K35_11195 [Undibacterium sp. LX40W]|uniref:DUF4175 family protein n=1 Tax=Undibacterium nitidum TaxID=2762298 RepID=A0A923KLF0_9BURK|nr:MULTISPECIES: hypothetical protein [Undibacterium]MBC3881775.1 hypothetical protein [Undibacterium nitidum]MBC3892228.1 hypothetical protein [Undibacterium sp. LX40W]
MHDALKHLRSSLFFAVLRQRALLYIAFAAPWVVAQYWPVLVALLVGFAIDGWRWHRHVEHHLVSFLNASCAELEDSSQLLWQAETSIARLQQQRLWQRLEKVLNKERIRLMAQQLHQFGWTWRIALVFNLLLAGIVWMQFFHTPVFSKTSTPVRSSVAIAPSDLRLKVVPPAYTGIAAFESEAKELNIPEHSLITWCVQQSQLGNTSSMSQEIRLSDGQTLSLYPEAKEKSGNHCVSWEASESVFWTWSGDPKAQRWNLKVKLDQAPIVEIQKPVEMLQVLSVDTKQFTIAVRVADDYKISNATLHLTLARGSGENIRFSDKEVALPQGTDPRVRIWQKQWTLNELGMEAGDELYFFVRASDNAMPAPHITTSATYTVRLPSPEAKEEQTSVLPILVKPESLRSQRQIIIDTEQLVADMKANSKINPDAIRARSETIANDQAALRRRYGRFLGEESTLFGEEAESEHEEHGDQHNAGEYKPVDMAAAYGHAHDQAENATLFDEATKKILRKVLAAMWDAEKSLRSLNPTTALAPENKALEGIKQLQQADRIYLHKAAFTPPVIKEEKRLTGDVLEARNWKSKPSNLVDHIPLEIRELIQDLSQAKPLPALWSKTTRSWFAQTLKDEEQRLAAQAAVQDVLDGCEPCRAPLRAWLRLSLGEGRLLLQAPETLRVLDEQSANKSRMQKAWKDSGLLLESNVGASK